MAKKINIDTLLKRIEALETRLDKLDPISKRKLLLLIGSSLSSLVSNASILFNKVSILIFFAIISFFVKH